jgi:hypothetical protein
MSFKLTIPYLHWWNHFSFYFLFGYSVNKIYSSLVEWSTNDALETWCMLEYKILVFVVVVVNSFPICLTFLFISTIWIHASVDTCLIRFRFNLGFLIVSIQLCVSDWKLIRFSVWFNLGFFMVGFYIGMHSVRLLVFVVVVVNSFPICLTFLFISTNWIHASIDTCLIRFRFSLGFFIVSIQLCVSD